MLRRRPKASADAGQTLHVIEIRPSFVLCVPPPAAIGGETAVVTAAPSSGRAGKRTKTNRPLDRPTGRPCEELTGEASAARGSRVTPERRRRRRLKGREIDGRAWEDVRLRLDWIFGKSFGDIVRTCLHNCELNVAALPSMPLALVGQFFALWSGVKETRRYDKLTGSSRPPKDGGRQ